jgi:hypothetical protein
MLTLWVNHNCKFKTEIRYTATFLLNGIDFNLQEYEQVDTKLSFDNGSSLIIEDHFFSKFDSVQSYLQLKNIPTSCSNFYDPQISRENIIVLFGNSKVDFTVHTNGTTELRSSIDLFASVFFMLSRWEEYLPLALDDKGRIKSTETTPVKLGFYKRAVVEEWKRFFEDIVMKIAPHFVWSKPTDTFTIIPTHDIDTIFYSFHPLVMAADVLKAKVWWGPFRRIYHFFKRSNPFDTFDFLMDQSEKLGLKSVFYLMGDGRSPLDSRYDGRHCFVQKFVRKIKEREHLIGLHPGCETFNNEQEFRRQLHYVQEYCQIEINLSRHHRLKYILPDSLDIWERCGIAEDSSMGYVDVAGFRCGTGRRFKMFHVLKQQETSVFQRPLIFMDGHFHGYRNLHSLREKAALEIVELENVCRKYNFPYTILFHNTSFDDIRWPGWKNLYADYFIHLLN